MRQKTNASHHLEWRNAAIERFRKRVCTEFGGDLIVTECNTTTQNAGELDVVDFYRRLSLVDRFGVTTFLDLLVKNPEVILELMANEPHERLRHRLFKQIVKKRADPRTLPLLEHRFKLLSAPEGKINEPVTEETAQKLHDNVKQALKDIKVQGSRDIRSLALLVPFEGDGMRCYYKQFITKTKCQQARRETGSDSAVYKSGIVTKTLLVGTTSTPTQFQPPPLHPRANRLRLATIMSKKYDLKTIVSAKIDPEGADAWLEREFAALATPLGVKERGRIFNTLHYAIMFVNQSHKRFKKKKGRYERLVTMIFKFIESVMRVYLQEEQGVLTKDARAILDNAEGVWNARKIRSINQIGKELRYVAKVPQEPMEEVSAEPEGEEPESSAEDAEKVCEATNADDAKSVQALERAMMSEEFQPFHVIHEIAEFLKTDKRYTWTTSTVAEKVKLLETIRRLMLLAGSDRCIHPEFDTRDAYIAMPANITYPLKTRPQSPGLVTTWETVFFEYLYHTHETQKVFEMNSYAWCYEFTPDERQILEPVLKPTSRAMSLRAIRAANELAKQAGRDPKVLAIMTPARFRCCANSYGYRENDRHLLESRLPSSCFLFGGIHIDAGTIQEFKTPEKLYETARKACNLTYYTASPEKYPEIIKYLPIIRSLTDAAKAPLKLVRPELEVRREEAMAPQDRLLPKPKFWWEFPFASEEPETEDSRLFAEMQKVAAEEDAAALLPMFYAQEELRKVVNSPEIEERKAGYEQLCEFLKMWMSESVPVHVWLTQARIWASDNENKHPREAEDLLKLLEAVPIPNEVLSERNSSKIMAKISKLWTADFFKPGEDVLNICYSLFKYMLNHATEDIEPVCEKIMNFLSSFDGRMMKLMVLDAFPDVQEAVQKFVSRRATTADVTSYSKSQACNFLRTIWAMRPSFLDAYDNKILEALEFVPLNYSLDARKCLSSGGDYPSELALVRSKLEYDIEQFAIALAKSRQRKGADGDGDDGSESWDNTCASNDRLPTKTTEFLTMDDVRDFLSTVPVTVSKPSKDGGSVENGKNQTAPPPPPEDVYIPAMTTRRINPNFKSYDFLDIGFEFLESERFISLLNHGERGSFISDLVKAITDSEYLYDPAVHGTREECEKLGASFYDAGAHVLVKPPHTSEIHRDYEKSIWSEIVDISVGGRVFKIRMHKHMARLIRAFDRWSPDKPFLPPWLRTIAGKDIILSYGPAVTELRYFIARLISKIVVFRELPDGSMDAIDGETALESGGASLDDDFILFIYSPEHETYRPFFAMMDKKRWKHLNGGSDSAKYEDLLETVLRVKYHGGPMDEIIRSRFETKRKLKLWTYTENDKHFLNEGVYPSLPLNLANGYISQPHHHETLPYDLQRMRLFHELWGCYSDKNHPKVVASLSHLLHRISSQVPQHRIPLDSVVMAGGTVWNPKDNSLKRISGNCQGNYSDSAAYPDLLTNDFIKISILLRLSKDDERVPLQVDMRQSGTELSNLTKWNKRWRRQPLVVRHLLSENHTSEQRLKAKRVVKASDVLRDLRESPSWWFTIKRIASVTGGNGETLFSENFLAEQSEYEIHFDRYGTAPYRSGIHYPAMDASLPCDAVFKQMLDTEILGIPEPNPLAEPAAVLSAKFHRYGLNRRWMRDLPSGGQDQHLAHLLKVLGEAKKLEDIENWHHRGLLEFLYLFGSMEADDQGPPVAVKDAGLTEEEAKECLSTTLKLIESLKEVSDPDKPCDTVPEDVHLIFSATQNFCFLKSYVADQRFPGREKILRRLWVRVQKSCFRSRRLDVLVHILSRDNSLKILPFCQWPGTVPEVMQLCEAMIKQTDGKALRQHNIGIYSDAPIFLNFPFTPFELWQMFKNTIMDNVKCPLSRTDASTYDVFFRTPDRCGSEGDHEDCRKRIDWLFEIADDLGEEYSALVTGIKAAKEADKGENCGKIIWRTFAEALSPTPAQEAAGLPISFMKDFTPPLAESNPGGTWSAFFKFLVWKEFMFWPLAKWWMKRDGHGAAPGNLRAQFAVTMYLISCVIKAEGVKFGDREFLHLEFEELLGALPMFLDLAQNLVTRASLLVQLLNPSDYPPHRHMLMRHVKHGNLFARVALTHRCSSTIRNQFHD